MQLTDVLSPSITLTTCLGQLAKGEKFKPLRKATAFTFGIPVAVLALAETILKLGIGIFVALLSLSSKFSPTAKNYFENVKLTALCVLAPSIAFINYSKIVVDGL